MTNKVLIKVWKQSKTLEVGDFLIIEPTRIFTLKIGLKKNVYLTKFKSSSFNFIKTNVISHAKRFILFFSLNDLTDPNVIRIKFVLYNKLFSFFFF